jgi:hypothetical protein
MGEGDRGRLDRPKSQPSVVLADMSLALGFPRPYQTQCQQICKAQQLSGYHTLKIMLHEGHRVIIVLRAHLLNAWREARDW